MKRFIFSIIAVIAIFSFELNAQWSTSPTVNTVVTTATDLQGSAQICTSSDGGYIIVWNDNRNGNYDIYAQKMNAYGVAQWTADGVAICTASNNQQTPQIVADANGGAIITWEDSRGANKDIYAQRINSSGSVQWTANGVAVCTQTGDQFSALISSDGSSGAIIAWNDNRAGGAAYDIYAQRISSGGATQWTSGGEIITNSVGLSFSPAIISDGSGGAIIAWYESNDIYAQKITSAGSVQWTANGELVCGAVNQQMQPALTSDGSGGAIITWFDRRFSNDGDIYAQRINSSGSDLWTADGVIICNETNIQTKPVIASDGAGGAVIAWDDQRSGGSYDVYTQKVNSSGVVQWTSNGVAITTKIGSEEQSRIISDGSGGAIIAFTDKASPTNTYDIYAQRINSSGTILWTSGGVAICSATGHQDSPRITTDGTGGAVITWYDPRSGTGDIYAQYINAGGTLAVMKPAVTTATISTIGITTATGGGNVTNDGGETVSARGVCWNTSTNPTTSNGHTTDGSGTGTFISNLTNLAPNTLHYVRAYATNSAGTSYGDNVTFTTIPTLPEWGLIALITLSAGIGGWMIWRRYV
jgi:hypothetical protein